MGLIGNCSFMAHIDQRGHVLWMCWPRFDSSFVFGALLDAEKGGAFVIQPATDDWTSEQYYLENTNVLATEFECADGAFRLLDFAPRAVVGGVKRRPRTLVRLIERLRGTPLVVARCEPVEAYGERRGTPVERDGRVTFDGLESDLQLTTDAPLAAVVAGEPFVLNGDRACCLSYGRGSWDIESTDGEAAPFHQSVRAQLDATVAYWRDWVRTCTVPCFAQEQVIRSALALKLHHFEDTGAFVAASTTSLPEAPGSTRNWDYRYCWVRDTYYTLSALDQLGKLEEAAAFATFVDDHIIRSSGRIQPLYAIDGTPGLLETTLPLAGYQGNQPVRIGNQAHEHIQNDAFGQLLLSLLPLYVDRRFVTEQRPADTAVIDSLLDRIEATMDDEDAGLWELRGMAWKHCYTFLFHWAGANAAQRIAEELGDPRLARRAAGLRDAASRQIEACFDRDIGTYVHAIGSTHMDASLLQLIGMQYLDPTSARANRLLETVEETLMIRPGFLHRYNHADDFGMPEVAFVVCGFWYIDALACVGRTEEAIEAFDQVMGAANGLGLLAEDAHPEDGSQWGNFPQTYSHVGLIGCAFRIAERLETPRYLEPGVGGATSIRDTRRKPTR
ncbi:MAG: GH15 family glucan-1,4-alpha-glucosidase [Myxococcota bacterium]|jgi:GH15 family glucan-1,4-alpha-glucosidase